MKRTITTLLTVLGLGLLASPAFAAPLTEEDVVMGKVQVTTIFCIRAPCPGPFVTLKNPGQPDVVVVGDLSRVIALNEEGKTIAVTGELSADGKTLRARSYLPFSHLPVDPAPTAQATQGANVPRDAKTQGGVAATTAAQQTARGNAGTKR